MYVRDELGGFPGCACSLLLSVSLFSPIGGGDQHVLVTAFLCYMPMLNPYSASSSSSPLPLLSECIWITGCSDVVSDAFLSRAYIIYTLPFLSRLVHSSASRFCLSSSPDGSDVACIRWSFRSMCGSLQGASAWFILLNCAVIVLLHSSLKGVKGPSFPSELKFFSPRVSILFMGK